MKIKQRFLNRCKFKIHLLLLFSFIAIFSSLACTGEQSKNSYTQTTSVDDEAKSNVQKKNVVVLLHGLNAPNDLEKLQTELGGALSNDKSYEILRLERYNSSKVPISTQADEMYLKIRQNLSEKELDENSSIVLLGDSQGGLVAAEIYRLYNEKLNIVGIIGNHTPWLGAPSVVAPDNKLNELEQTIKPILNNIGDKLDIPGINISQFTNQLGQDNLKNILASYLGVASNDLDPQGQCIKNIKNTLNNINIPVLAIGGHIPFWDGVEYMINFFASDTHLNINGAEIIKLIQNMKVNDPSIAPLIQLLMDNIANQFTSVMGNEQNDLMVPLSSQIMREINNSKIKKVIIENYHHFYGITNHNNLVHAISLFISNCHQGIDCENIII